VHRVRHLCEAHTRIIVSSRRSVLAALWRLIRASSADCADQPQSFLSETETKTIMESCGFERVGRSSPRIIFAMIA
jgi:hypothetical protein